MKAKDVKTGVEYLTRVGPDTVRVMVSSVCAGRLNYSTGKEGPRRFYCKRVDNGTVLPKARTAAALREAPPPKRMYAVHDGNGTLLAKGRSSKAPAEVAALMRVRFTRAPETADDLTIVPIHDEPYGGDYKVMRGEEERGVIHVTEVTS